MFTGIINNSATIKKIEFSKKKDCNLTISLNKKTERNLDIGCSISCNGICLTLVKNNKNNLYFQASDETSNLTTIKNWKEKQILNIEFALRPQDEIGGHFVTGHIDGIAYLNKINKVKDSWIMDFTFDKKYQNLSKFVFKKGSITIDGISLTVNSTNKHSFSVNIIKHTFNNTNLSQIKLNDAVNIEIDLIARIVKSK